MWSDLLFYSKQVFLFVGLTKKKKKMMWEDKWLLVMVETIVDQHQQEVVDDVDQSSSRPHFFGWSCIHTQLIDLLIKR